MIPFASVRDQLRSQFKLITDQCQYLFQVDTKRGVLWNSFLESFEEEHKQEHRCQACNSFINRYGNVVGIHPNTYQILSIWDFSAEGRYASSIKNMREEIHTLPIRDVFVSDQSELGIARSLGTTWEHFHYSLPSKFLTHTTETLDSVRAKHKASFKSLVKTHQLVGVEVVETVLEMIEQGKVNRGEQFKSNLQTLFGVLLEADQVNPQLRSNYFWLKAMEHGPGVTHLRGQSIGVLMNDLAEGVPESRALARINDNILAAQNYQRSVSSPSSTRLISSAKKKFEEMGLMPSLNRRFATVDDIPQDALIFTDKDNLISDDVFGDLQSETTVDVSKIKNVRKVGIESFLSDILPCTSMEILLTNEHSSHLASILTACDPSAPNLMKWDNPVSWSYNGDATDSIKQRVKKAGGDVDAKLRVSLAWDGRADYDLYLTDPKEKIYHGHKEGRFGYLDVDANYRSIVDNPVENIRYKSTVPEGSYFIEVNNFTQRKMMSPGFSIEIEYLGKSFFLKFDRNLGSMESIKVGNFSIKDNQIIVRPGPNVSLLDKEAPLSSSKLWGLTPNRFHKVKYMMLSPNYWGDNQVGNKHYFFTLEGCTNTADTRGFFTEFIRDDLREYRKIMEQLGNKTMVKYQKGIEQLSGLGFSSTSGDKFICKVVKKGRPQLIEITFDYGKRFLKEEEDNAKGSRIVRESSRAKATI